jgi:hypothetical protein
MVDSFSSGQLQLPSTGGGGGIIPGIPGSGGGGGIVPVIPGSGGGGGIVPNIPCKYKYCMDRNDQFRCILKPSLITSLHSA